MALPYDFGSATTPDRNFFLQLQLNFAAIEAEFTPVAFVNLPSSPVIGQRAIVTNSNTAVWGATVAAGGGNTVLAWFNGTVWTVIGI